MLAASVPEVISILDQIISDCTTKASRLGYFAALYRKMTRGVWQGIQSGSFEDPARMEQLDVVFANRYFAAYAQFANGQPPTNCWSAAFKAASSDDLIVLQHLLLGMNAHINLDLAIAAAQISTPQTIDSLHNDYLKINSIIAGFFQSVQADLTKIAFPMRFIALVDPSTTNAVLNFSISKARDAAWNNALLLCAAGDGQEAPIINTYDHVVTTVAQGIAQPGGWSSLLLKGIKACEQKDIAQNIVFLNQD
ncbi:MAG: hypothetical protein J7539_15400 [Niabella sp.]|nr:hypothetical protein [Niabella sp.]